MYSKVNGCGQSFIVFSFSEKLNTAVALDLSAAMSTDCKVHTAVRANPCCDRGFRINSEEMLPEGIVAGCPKTGKTMGIPPRIALLPSKGARGERYSFSCPSHTQDVTYHKIILSVVLDRI